MIGELGLERIDLLKIDVQRAEMDVLLGLDDAALAKVRQIVLEVMTSATVPPPAAPMP